jgi:DNA-binding transcriptional MocR family regulator
MVEPMYRQIAEDIQRSIEAGELRPGSQLPTELELRDRYSVSRNTVRDAIKLLINRGLHPQPPATWTRTPWNGAAVSWGRTTRTP